MIQSTQHRRGVLTVSRDDDSSVEGCDQTPPQALSRVLKSQDLLQGSKEVLITHHGETYRLRETKNGKLLLLK